MPKAERLMKKKVFVSKVQRQVHIHHPAARKDNFQKSDLERRRSAQELAQEPRSAMQLRWPNLQKLP